MFLAKQLLHPISADQPAGADLSFSPELDAINHARRSDDPSLDQGEWVTALKEADWDFVITQCCVLIEERSKDLQLAAYLTEAASRQYQLRGLAQGFLLLAGLLDRYWDCGLHPASDGNDHDQRIRNLSWILGRAPALLREIRVTEGVGGYSTTDFELARKKTAGTSSLADLEAALRSNGAVFSDTFRADAHSCMAALLQLEKTADQRLGSDSPGFSGTRDALQELIALMPPPVDTPAGRLPGKALEQPALRADQLAAIEPVTSRAQAVAQLRALAQFFRRTEPHSPASYFADKAADAGEQNLHAWLRSVVKDPVSMAHIEELLGIAPGSSTPLT
ncbi:MAG TPA: type VI secretion system protein TssA [Telluria sp.]|jgi:type VI secretion system protein ImpA